MLPLNQLGPPSCNRPGNQATLGNHIQGVLAVLALLAKRPGTRLPVPCVLQPLPKKWPSISVVDGPALRCGTL